MKKKVFLTLCFLFFINLLLADSKNDIFRWIHQEKEESNMISVKLMSEKENFQYGEDIILRAEIQNNSEECLAVYSQPYYFVVNGKKKNDNFVLVRKFSSDPDQLSNYILIGQNKVGGIIWKPLEGSTYSHFYDVLFPLEIIFKSNERIKEIIKIPANLYKKYITKGDIEICIWKGWRKFGRTVNKNIIREILFENNDYVLIEKKIDLNQIISLKAINNYIYFLHSNRKKERKIYYVRSRFKAFMDHITVSNSISIIIK